MGKVLGWLLVILLVVGGLTIGARAFATRMMTQRAVTPKPLGAETPDSVGVPFSRVAVESGDRTLIGWWVRAGADSGAVPPALLFFHGNRTAISDYTVLQRFFYRQGISSLVFDYSGFGASGGSPSLKSAVEDAPRVARVFADSAGEGARKVAMGSALGATVLLQAIDSVQPYVNGIVIEGVDASVLETAVRMLHVPSFLARGLVDIGDNVAAASRVGVPMLAIHSFADQRVPISDAQRVVAAVSGDASLVRHWRRGHSAILNSSRPCDWAPVLAFVKAGALPAVKFDTTDACEVEAAELAAANAAKQAITPAGGAAAPADSAAAGATAAGADETKAVPTKNVETKPPSAATRPTATKTKAPPSTRTKTPSTKTPARRP